MGTIQYTRSPGVPHQSMQEEFLCHRNGSEWWYSTGYVTDESGKLYSYQFTLASVLVYRMRIRLLMTALSDFQTGKHYYSQLVLPFGRRVTITHDRVGVAGRAEMEFGDKRVAIHITTRDYTLALETTVVKPAVWHCDNGVLRMGVDDPKETTYYWSYTNLAAAGELTMHGRPSKVAGKAWFDKQGGTYNIINRWTHWEWFSLRFFDDEEIMLFVFPQDNYQDGTFIAKSGEYGRLNRYSIKPLGFTHAGGKKFSFGWEVEIPGVKEEHYTIVPKMDGQLNLTYYELLADIRNPEGHTVGHCVVELLPGVLNEKIKVGAVLARIK